MFMCVFVFTPPRPEESFLSLDLIVGIVVHPLARSSIRCLPPPPSVRLRLRSIASQPSVSFFLFCIRSRSVVYKLRVTVDLF